MPDPIVIVIASIAGGLILAVLFAKVVLRSLRGPLEARIAASHGEDEILMKDLTANNFGLESKGVFQLRGNGALVLTAEELHFFMFLPRRELRVPLSAITELAIVKSHLGKATLRDLLKVRFAAGGRPDSIAWCLAEPQAWKQRIEEIQAGAPGASRR
jgi:hypothetical protein